MIKKCYAFEIICDFVYIAKTILSKYEDKNNTIDMFSCVKCTIYSKLNNNQSVYSVFIYTLIIQMIDCWCSMHMVKSKQYF